MLNVFDANPDAFGIVAMSTAIDKLKFVPGRLGSLGIFEEERLSVIDVAIEQRGGILELIAPTPRGGPGVTLDKDKRVIRSIRPPHFQIDDAINADEVQNVRAFGTENVLETVIGAVNRRLGIHSQSLDATEEYARVGAVKGIVTYPDGSTLNLFDFFGVTAPTEIDLDLDNASPAEGVLRRKVAGIVRQIGAAMEGAPFSGVRAEVGDAFFDDLIAHKEVRDTFKNTVAAQQLLRGYVAPFGQSSQIYATFEFGGVIWENYRGQVGSTAYIDTNKAYFFPIGAPGMFKSIYVPADYEESVNTVALKRYAKQWAKDNGKGRNLESQTNVLHIATRPGALASARRT